MDTHAEKIEQEGRCAFNAGNRLADCPFGSTAGFDAYCWRRGWRTARAEWRQLREKSRLILPFSP
jgi:hypothetical protein